MIDKKITFTLTKVNNKFFHIFKVKNYSKGFTIAEVLITLGIIGVIAAITLPTLIKNYQKHVWVNALKVNYSMLNQGFKKIMADNMVDNIEDTNMFKNDGISLGTCFKSNGAFCKKFNDEFKKYFKVISIEKMEFSEKSLNNVNYTYNNYVINLANGSRIYYHAIGSSEINDTKCQKIKAAGGHVCSTSGYFSIDINGGKGPNTFGRDIFSFWISPTGDLIPEGGKDITLLTNPDATESAWQTSCKDNKNDGLDCAGRVIEEGWKMTY